ncbi:hypothetical protein C2S53_003304 [Perilla frutescens var. hirtella]|uniref:Tf2-1-like SH3-like domain-containing protein n=1 Tax=Perilla frutescens var. hirtella TaxID=608512 RepID=A0AAD4JRK7_PERFH|nr:hypothetical protein C2S53_003304 [Perilla frutescens var. hirtella]
MFKNLKITTVGIKSGRSSEMADDISLDDLEEILRNSKYKLRAEIQKRETWELQFQEEISAISTRINQRLDQISIILVSICGYNFEGQLQRQFITIFGVENQPFPYSTNPVNPSVENSKVTTVTEMVSEMMGMKLEVGVEEKKNDDALINCWIGVELKNLCVETCFSRGKDIVFDECKVFDDMSLKKIESSVKTSKKMCTLKKMCLDDEDSSRREVDFITKPIPKPPPRKMVFFKAQSELYSRTCPHKSATETEGSDLSWQQWTLAFAWIDPKIEQGYMCKIVMVNLKAFVDSVVNEYERLSDDDKSKCLEFFLGNRPMLLWHPHTKEGNAKLEKLVLGCDAPDDDDNHGGNKGVAEEVPMLNTDMHGYSSETESNPDESNSVNSEGTSKSNDLLVIMASNLGWVNENNDAINYAILPSQGGMKNRRVNQLVNHEQRNRQKLFKDWFVVRAYAKHIIFHQKSCSVVQAFVDELEIKDRADMYDIKATSISAGKHEIISAHPESRYSPGIQQKIEKSNCTVGPDGVLFIELSSCAAVKKELQVRISQLERELSETNVVYDCEELVEGITKISTRYYNPYKILQTTGEVASRLESPEDSRVHLIFHVFLLKNKIGAGIIPWPELTEISPDGTFALSLTGILEQCTILQDNEPLEQALAQG